MKLQLALHLLLLKILQLYHLPPPIFPPVSNSSCLYTSCQPLYVSCHSVLLYFSRYCTIRLKSCFIFLFFMCLCAFLCVCFSCIICVKSILNLLQYSTMKSIVLVGYLGQLCWTYKQTGLTNTLLEWNSFIYSKYWRLAFSSISLFT